MRNSILVRSSSIEDEWLTGFGLCHGIAQLHKAGIQLPPSFETLRQLMLAGF